MSFDWNAKDFARAFRNPLTENTVAHTYVWCIEKLWHGAVTEPVRGAKLLVIFHPDSVSFRCTFLQHPKAVLRLSISAAFLGTS